MTPPVAKAKEVGENMGEKRTELLSLNEAARALGLDKARVRALVEAGFLPGYRLPGVRRYYIPRRALEAFLEGRLTNGKNPAGQGGE